MLSSLLHAPPLSFLSGSPSRLLSKHNAARPSMAATSARIAVVGDVHDQWNLEEDTKALQFLQAGSILLDYASTLCVFLSRSLSISAHAFTFLPFPIGDFGEENIELVRSVANLEFAKAVILGNHDAWHTKKFSGKKKDGVQLQLEWYFMEIIPTASSEPKVRNICSGLGEEHVAYRCLDFPMVKLSIVGGRPFSSGGKQLFRLKLLSARYGVQGMDGSAKRICKEAMGAPEEHMVIILAHNGPTGLGSNLDDICGKDWESGGGDHGDADLAQALSLIKETGKFCVPLVVFGHMHKKLADGNGLRKMIVVGADNTIYLNGAIVPRVKRLNDEQGAGNTSFMINEPHLTTPPESCGTTRAFTLVEILDGGVDRIVETWVSVVGDRTKLEEEHILFKSGS